MHANTSRRRHSRGPGPRQHGRTAAAGFPQARHIKPARCRAQTPLPAQSRPPQSSKSAVTGHLQGGRERLQRPWALIPIPGAAARVRAAPSGSDPPRCRLSKPTPREAGDEELPAPAQERQPPAAVSSAIWESDRYDIIDARRVMRAANGRGSSSGLKRCPPAVLAGRPPDAGGALQRSQPTPNFGGQKMRKMRHQS